jgi:carbonic anhydrase
VNEIDRLLAANAAYASVPPERTDSRPRRGLAVVTCMDARIDVFAVLGLQLGDAHVMRNAGGRVTDDVLRSLALSTHVFGTDTVVLMQHTGCGLVGVTDEELRALTKADLGFYAIADHAAALREDVELVATKPYLELLRVVAGFVYDIESGSVDDVVRWERSSSSSSRLRSSPPP